jgi:hypothetical protein
MAKKETSKEDMLYDKIIILKSVFEKVTNMKYFIQPCRDKSGLYPSCVRKVDSNGDMILSTQDRDDFASGKKVFFPEDHVFTITSGKKYDLTNPADLAEWECIKNCKLIAKSRDAKDENGNFIIDGTPTRNGKPGRNGIAELYIDRPGLETARKVSRKKLIYKAQTYIYEDPRGADGQLNMALILGKDMTNQPNADVVDFLVRQAEKDPQKIINLYTGQDTSVRILFIQAKKKRIIYIKDKLYIYGNDIILGATEDAAIAWLKDPRNQKVVEYIQKDTFPELFPNNGKEDKE